MRTASLMIPIAVSLSLGLASAETDYTTLDAHGDPLRSAFNADADKVRVLMLVAPT